MNENEIKFLICDDSILARKSLSSVLNSLNYTNITEVSNGEDAVNMYKQMNPDIVLLDIVMPIKDGITATKEIIAYDPNATVIMVSSVGTQTNLREALKAGATDFVQKPIEKDLLAQIIQHHLN